MRPTRHSISDPDQARAAAELIGRLPHIDIVLDRYDVVSARTPAPWSRLGSDDAVTRWLQVSHQLFTILAMCSDNLRVAREIILVGGEMIVPMYAHYPVLRSVIEAAAPTSWISQPDNQSERLRRSLSARIADLNEDKDLHTEAMKAAALHGQLDGSFLKLGVGSQSERDRDLAIGR
jgi:hypothetical protein